MKRIVVISTVAAVLSLTAIIIVRAETRGSHGWCGNRWHHPGPTGYIAHQLKLSDPQKAQIQTLWQEELPTISTHIHEFLAENKAMSAIAVRGNPDQSEVQKRADREANTIATLLVEKARLQSKIYSTILNPEQRVKADALEKEWEFRVDRLADHLETQQQKNEATK
jgi:Spy/CpxP family protein refolding chaperone